MGGRVREGKRCEGKADKREMDQKMKKDKGKERGDRLALSTARKHKHTNTSLSARDRPVQDAPPGGDGQSPAAGPRPSGTIRQGLFFTCVSGNTNKKPSVKVNVED